MRRNIFLHFLNRDSREVYNLYGTQTVENHAAILRRALNASVLLCEDSCILPPGFVIEDDIAFGLAEAQLDYLSIGILQFPLREGNLADYAEKKRSEYQPMRDRYSGLFNDNRLDFLSRHATGLIRRKTHITQNILTGWMEGIDTNQRAWKPVKGLLPAKIIEPVRQIPSRLSTDGIALTWSAIAPHLGGEAAAAAKPLRNALQYTYFRQYCDEFRLVTMSELPFMLEDFYLPRQPEIYNYRRFHTFLSTFNLSVLLLDAPASFVVRLRECSGFISLMDAYASFAKQRGSLTDIAFAASRAAKASGFAWAGLGLRYDPFNHLPDDLELLELDHAMSAAAQAMVEENGLEVRAAGKLVKDAHPLSASRGASVSDLVIFVALQEELEVLAKSLALRLNPSAPAADGKLGDHSVSILCPRDMGRVPAAVEVARYLEARKANKPKLLLVVGLAGGFELEGSQPGHIISVTTVVDLAHRKVSDDDKGNASSRFRRKDYALHQGLRDLLLSDRFDQKAWVDVSIELANWPKDRRPSLHVGKLASVDEVVASKDWVGQMAAAEEKLLGVEMEAGGVCEAAAKYGVPVSMLRVVSDKADPAKADDHWRRTGMLTLAELMRRLSVKDLLDVLE